MGAGLRMRSTIGFRINRLGVFVLAAQMMVGISSAQTTTSAERTLFQMVNRERHAAGLPALRWDDTLASAARQHAGVMAAQRSVAHVFPGEASLPGRATQAGAHFSWLSENVIESTDSVAAHAQFMASPTHRANILDSDMDTVGIGIVERSGRLYVVEDFEKAK
jgi:uncharacterized protein YkwD